VLPDLAQVNGIVRGAAVLFARLEAVSLRRAASLQDASLLRLAAACGAHLKVPLLSPTP
jgi:hypothetical protein